MGDSLWSILCDGVGMKLKQITEKKERLCSYYPLSVDLVRVYDGWLEAQFVYNSSAISGNCLNRRRAVMVMDKGITSQGTLKDHLEVINQARVLNWMIKWAKHPPRLQLSSVTEKDIYHLHSLLMEGVDDQNIGKYRKIPIRIQDSCITVPDSNEILELMAEYVAWLNQDHISHPVDLAAQAHLKFLKIRPFVSGNSFLARLLMNLVLLSLGYPITYIRVEDRERYYASLESSYLGDQSDYLSLIYEAVDRSLEKYLYAAENSLGA